MMRHHGIRSATALAALLAAGACSTPAPLRQQALPAGFNAVAAATDPVDAERLARWWHGFDDPMLVWLVGESLDRNLDIQLSLARIRQARAQLRRSRAALLPELDVPGQASRQWIDGGLGDDDSPVGDLIGGNGSTLRFDQWQIALQASWEPDIFGAGRTRAAAADRQVGAAEAQAVATRIAIASNVAQAYVQAVGLAAQARLLDDGIALALESERATRGLFRIGRTTRLDINAALAERTRLEAQRQAVEGALAEAGYAIDTLLDRPPGTARALIGDRVEIPAADAAIPVGQPIDLLRRRPDVIAATAGLAAAELEAVASRRDLFPSLGLTALAGRSGLSVGDFSAASNLASVAAQLTFPWLSPTARAAVGIADADRQEGFVELRRTLATALQEVEVAAAQGRARERERIALDRALAAALERDRMARRAFELGHVDLPVVLEAQEGLLTVREAAVENRQALAIAQITLFTALGGGWNAGDGNEAGGDDGVGAVRRELRDRPIRDRILEDDPA